MKDRKIILSAFALVILFAVASFFTFNYSHNIIRNGYLKSEGSSAQDMATLAARNFKMTDDQYDELMTNDYQHMLDSAEYKAFAKMFGVDQFKSQIDYAYIMLHLPPDQVKYKIDESNKDMFDAKIGTDLDIMWLLDVRTSGELVNKYNSDKDKYSADIERYGYYIDIDDQIFNNSPTYVINESEWGDHICGYAPFYTVEGTYVGVLGVEIVMNDYKSYSSRAMHSLIFLFVVSSLALSVLFLYLYAKYRSLQKEKVYTDPLTKLKNRNYYYDHFMKDIIRLKAKNDDVLVIIMADIDYFKSINDTYGHDIGDHVLEEMGKRLKAAFNGNLIIRFGGEEFLTALWLNSTDDISPMLDRLLVEIRNETFSSKNLNVKLSVGCCYSQAPVLTKEVLGIMVKSADEDLYYAKECGRDQYKISKY